MLNIRKFFEGIGIVAKTTSTADIKGELEVIDSSGKLQYHNGTSVSPVVTEAHSAPLTNKTIVVASNTVTTAASGNLTATELNAALAELQADIDTKAADSALTAHINDATDAHDASAISSVPAGNLAASDVQGALNELQSDVDTRALDSALTAHTGASSGVHGVTGAVVGTTDTQTLTNKTLTAPVISTISNTGTVTLPTSTDTLVGRDTTDSLTNKTMSDSLTFTQIATPSNPSSGRNRLYPKADGKFYNLDAAGVETELGAGAGGDVVGPASATDNAIARFDSTTGKLIQNSTVTVSDTGVIAGATLPAASVSYTPTTPADWLSVPTQGQEALDNLAAQRPVINLMKSATAYTPTFTGFGTVSGVEFYWSRVGSKIILNGKFTSGTPTVTEARISLPTGLTSAGISLIPSVTLAGPAVQDGSAAISIYTLIEPSKTYVTLGVQKSGSGGLVPINASDILGAGAKLSILAEFEIAEWAQSTTVDIFEAGDFGWTQFTPSFTNNATINSSNFFYRRVGDSMDIMGYVSFGSGGSASPLQLALPASRVIDSTKVPARRTFGDVNFDSNNASEYKVVGVGGNSYITIAAQAQPGGVSVDATGSGFSSINVFFQAKGVPISGWSTFPIGVATQAPRATLAFSDAAGLGSTDNKIPYYTNAYTSGAGSAYSWVNNSTLGLAVTIIEDGNYSITVNHAFTSAADIGISLNSNQLTTSIATITDVNRLCNFTTDGADRSGSCSITLPLTAGDVIRPHTDGAAASSGGYQQQFRITKVSN